MPTVLVVNGVQDVRQDTVPVAKKYDARKKPPDECWRAVVDESGNREY